MHMAQQYWTMQSDHEHTLISRNLQYSSQKKNFLFIFLTATWDQKIKYNKENYIIL